MARSPQAREAIGLRSDPLPVSEGFQRADALAHLPSVLRSLDIDPESVIAEVGLDPQVFGHPANEIPIAALGRLARLVTARSDCDHFGLLVGMRSGLESLGLVGCLVRHSPNVGTALRNLTAHLHLRDSGAVVPLLVSDGIASLGYEIHQAGVEGCDQLCDGAVAILANILRELCGVRWRASEVRLARRGPADLRPHRTFFNAPLHFDSDRNALLFPASWLERRTIGADASLYANLDRQVAALEQRMDDLVPGCRRMLRVVLLSGKGSVDDVAARLALHRRTLNRVLRARGTSVHQLVEETRSTIARQLVANTRMPLTEIAATLGYADASAFTRAFRRWTGAAPSAWRRGGVAGSRAMRPARRSRRADARQQSGWNPSGPPPYQYPSGPR